jgi:hypothetical protein
MTLHQVIEEFQEAGISFEQYLLFIAIHGEEGDYKVSDVTDFMSHRPALTYH